MSLVTIMASNKFLTLMSDGRVTQILEDGTSRPVDENTKKFFTSGNRYFCAYVGYFENFSSFIELAKLKEPDLSNLEDFAKEVSEHYKKLDDIGKEMDIVFGGKNKDGVIKYYVINEAKTGFEEVEPGIGEYKYVILNSPNIKGKDVEEKLWELSNIYCPCTPESMLFVQQEINKYVASIDYTVNNNIFYDVII